MKRSEKGSDCRLDLDKDSVCDPSCTAALVVRFCRCSVVSGMTGVGWFPAAMDHRRAELRLNWQGPQSSRLALIVPSHLRFLTVIS